MLALAGDGAQGIQVALELERLLALLAEFALGAFGGQLGGGVRGLQLVDGL